MALGAKFLVKLADELAKSGFLWAIVAESDEGGAELTDVRAFKVFGLDRVNG